MNISDAELLQYLDRSLDQHAQTRVRAALAHDTDARARLEAMEASQLPYCAAFKHYDEPEVPDTLRDEVATWAALSRQSPDAASPGSFWMAPRQRLIAVAAAAAMVGVLVGYAGTSAYFNDRVVVSGIGPTADSSETGFGPTADSRETGIGPTADSGETGIGPTTDSSETGIGPTTDSSEKSGEKYGVADAAWVQRVADYQSLYVPETVEHIVGGQAQAERLLSTLEEQTRLSTAIPDLGDFEYEFVRAQQLGYEGQPLVQLVYKRPGRKPLALCYMPGDLAIAKADSDTHVNAYSIGSLGTAYWRQSGQRYVIVAEESAATLQAVASQARLSWPMGG